MKSAKIVRMAQQGAFGPGIPVALARNQFRIKRCGDLPGFPRNTANRC